MGEFKKSVQNDKIAGPLRRAFTEKSWRKSYEDLKTDSADENLFEAGIAIHRKASAIRQQQPTTSNRTVSATTKLRAILAVSNYDRVLLGKKTEGAISAAARDAKGEAQTVMVHELSAQKIRLLSGFSAKPSEIAEATVDGIELPIKDVLLPTAPNLTGNPRFQDVDWNHIGIEMNIGILYKHVEDIWDDCLWNEYEIHQQGAGYVFRPRERMLVESHTATRARADNLATQFAGMAVTYQKAMLAKGMLSIATSQDVIAVEKVGRKQVIKLGGKEGELSDNMHSLFTLRAYATEPYYRELLSEAQPLLEEASLQQFLSGWTVVSGASAALLREVSDAGESEVQEESPLAWLPRYAAVLKKDALATAVTKAAACSRSQAEAIVNFLTFKGAIGEELWSQPLVSVSPTAVVPVFAALSAPNLRRLVDIWLRQLGVDLSLRGPAFEAYMREMVQQFIAGSPLLSGSAACLDSALKFRSTAGRPEEIDLIFSLGSLVFVCELKCILAPSEAKQVAFHRKTIRDAVAQVQRKVAAVNANKTAFRNQLAVSGFNIPEDFEAVPLVVLSGAIHAGYEVDGVGVADEYTLSVFFEGEVRDAVLQEPNGQMRTVKKTVLYNTVPEAVNAARTYFLDPPQLKVFKGGLKQRQVPISRVSEEDWPGMYVAIECIPRPNVTPDEIESWRGAASAIPATTTFS